ncbi:hypothetical protein BD414DRAFT_539160 [Trametes punicea]|nr:hypothetical protein BD414DRAFT_539160 [Trametes punicea]
MNAPTIDQDRRLFDVTRSRGSPALLDELLAETVHIPPLQQFEDEIDAFLADGLTENAQSVVDSDPFAIYSFDWPSLFRDSPSRPMSPPWTLPSDGSLSPPLSPISAATIATSASSLTASDWLLSDSDVGVFSFSMVISSGTLGSPPSLASSVGYEQQHLQHSLSGAAVADAHGPGSGTAARPMALFPPTFLYPSSPCSPEPSDPPATAERKRNHKAEVENNDDDDDDDDDDNGGDNGGDEPVEVDKKPAKRRRRQDTTRRYSCAHCPSVFARSHNLKVHVESVHDGERRFACTVIGCGKAFGRKHDLVRHHQSKHTNLGSPRRKPARH